MNKSDLALYIYNYNLEKSFFKKLTNSNHPQMQELIDFYYQLEMPNNQKFDKTTINTIRSIINKTSGNGLTATIMREIQTQLNNEEEAPYNTNKFLLIHILEHNDKSGLKKWLAANPQLDQRNQGLVLRLLQDAIEKASRDKYRLQLVDALLTTEHTQIRELILGPCGRGILCMLIKHGFDEQAKFLTDHGVSPNRPYNANRVNIVYPNGTRPFQEFHGTSGLNIKDNIVKEKIHNTNKELFQQILQKNAKSSLENWLEANPQLDQIKKGQILLLLIQAIEKAAKDDGKLLLVDALRTTTHRQVRELILRQYGPGILCMLIKHGFNEQAKLLMEQGVDPTQAYNANLVDLAYPNGKRPFQEFHGVSGLKVAAGLTDKQLYKFIVEKEKSHDANRILFTQLLQKNDKSTLEKWLAANPQLDQRKQGQILLLFIQAIEGAVRDKDKLQLVNTLLTTTHNQTRKLILEQYGTGILCMLLEHKLTTQAKYLLKNGVSPIKRYNADLVNLAYKDGKKPFQKFHGLCGLSVATRVADNELFKNMARAVDEINDSKLVEERTTAKTLAFYQALADYQPDRAIKLQKHVDYDLRNTNGERVSNLALKSLTNFSTRYSPKSDSNYFNKISRSLEVIAVCLENTRSFSFNDSNDKQDFANFLFKMTAIFTAYPNMGEKNKSAELKEQFANILTHLIKAKVLSCDTLFTPQIHIKSLTPNTTLNKTDSVTNKSLSLYKILDDMDPELAQELKALETTGISRERNQGQAKMGPTFFSRSIDKKTQGSNHETSHESSPPSPKVVKFDM